MVIELTDEQVARVLELCAQVAALRQGMPALPDGFERNAEARIEFAKGIRASLESKNAVLLELGALLR